MIRVGCMSLSYRDIWQPGGTNLWRFLELATEMRLDGVELHSSALPDTEPATLRRVRQEAIARGLTITYLGISNNFGKSSDALKADVTATKRWIDVAAELRLPMVRVFAAWIPDGEDEEAVWSRLLDSMGEVARHGEERGVVVAVQNHNHGCLTRTGSDVLRILDTVNNPYLSHILDTGQYVGSPGASGADKGRPAEEIMYASIAQTAPRAVHVRSKFYRVSTGEERWLDYPRILGILRDVGYNGFMSVVYEGWDAEPSTTAVPKAVAYLRRVVAESGM